MKEPRSSNIAKPKRTTSEKKKLSPETSLKHELKIEIQTRLPNGNSDRRPGRPRFPSDRPLPHIRMPHEDLHKPLSETDREKLAEMDRRNLKERRVNVTQAADKPESENLNRDDSRASSETDEPTATVETRF